MVSRRRMMTLGLLALLAGCQATGTAGEQTAPAAGAAAGTAIGPSAGGSFGEVVGAGLVGGAAGNLGGQPLEVGEFRDPRFRP